VFSRLPLTVSFAASDSGLGFARAPLGIRKLSRLSSFPLPLLLFSGLLLTALSLNAGFCLTVSLRA
jgi:hypothetical protein